MTDYIVSLLSVLLEFQKTTFFQLSPNHLYVIRARLYIFTTWFFSSPLSQRLGKQNKNNFRIVSGYLNVLVCSNVFVRCFGEKNTYSYKLSWLDQKENKNNTQTKNLEKEPQIKQNCNKGIVTLKTKINGFWEKAIIIVSLLLSLYDKSRVVSLKGMMIK